MSHSKQGLRAIGLCFLAVLGTMAFAAASAQAVGVFLENNAALAVNLPVSLELDAGATNQPRLLVPNLNIEIVCTTHELLNGLLKPGGLALGTIEFRNCTTYELSPLVEQAACKPLEPIVAEVKAEVILHGAANTPYILFSPDNPPPTDLLRFTNILFHPPCALPLEVPIKGHVVVEDCTNEGLVEKAKHLIQQAPEALFPGPAHLLRFGAQPSRLDGSVWLKLNNGNNWSAH